MEARATAAAQAVVAAAVVTAIAAAQAVVATPTAAAAAEAAAAVAATAAAVVRAEHCSATPAGPSAQAMVMRVKTAATGDGHGGQYCQTGA